MVAIRQCGVKRRFPTLARASAMARSKGMQAYNCWLCGDYHIGHKPVVKPSKRFKKMGIKQNWKGVLREVRAKMSN